MCEYEFFTVFLHFESIKLEIMAKKKTVRKPKGLGEAIGFKNIFSNYRSSFAHS